MEEKNKFVQKTAENADLNQYWYSPATINKLVEEIEAVSKRCAFLSTPSLYFSLRDATLRDASFVFDLDEQWAKNPNFVRYDFKKPEDIPAALHGTFDCLVIDPPFITREVWELYAQAARLLLPPGGGKVICSTIQENKDMMKELLGAEPQKFLPSIPHLVYQYCMYTNYESELLSQVNPEIPPDY